MPLFDVHLITDCPPPARVADELDELLDVLNDVEATVEAPNGLLEVQATVEADDVVGAVRAGHGIVDRALITLGRVGTVTHAQAASVQERPGPAPSSAPAPL